MKKTVKFVFGICTIPGIILGFLYIIFKCSFMVGKEYAQSFARWLI